jgi:hypothetical protein
MTTLRVAAVQASYVLMDRDATIDRVAGLTAAAVAESAAAGYALPAPSDQVRADQATVRGAIGAPGITLVDMRSEAACGLLRPTWPTGPWPPFRSPAATAGPGPGPARPGPDRRRTA